MAEQKKERAQEKGQPALGEGLSEIEWSVLERSMERHDHALRELGGL